MPLRALLLPLLLPALVVAALVLALGNVPRAALAALVTLAGSVLTWLVARQTLGRQLAALARTTRRRAEGERPLASDEGPLEELATLAGAIDTLHAQLAAEQAQVAQEASTLGAVLDGMAEGVWVTDVEGTVRRHNSALLRLLSPAGEVVGQRPLALVRNVMLHEAVVRACRFGDTSDLELTVEGLLPRTLQVRVAPLGRGLSGSAAVFHDVTDLRRLEQVRKDFVANVSHELRTPITAIRGYAETLQGGALADPQVAGKMVDVIHRQSERLSALVEDLLELSRLESREVQLTREPVALADVAARVADVVRPRAAAKRQDLRLDVPEGLLAYADGRAVEQVLLNLLDNAVKYTPQGGQVDVRAARDGTRCRIEVQDSGVGIEAKHLPRLFERFYRVDPGRSRDSGGTGLGLSIVKHLVGAMNGDVRVESEPHRGSTFTVLLPAVPPPAPAPG